MWSFIRTHYKREPLIVRPNDELEIATSTNDLTNPTNPIIEVDEFNGSYTNETFECRILSVGSTGESAFVDCRFPELVSLKIDRPARSTFIRCRFPKLRTIRIQKGEEVFVSCHLARINQEEVHQDLVSNCQLTGVHPDYTYLYEGTGELDW